MRESEEERLNNKMEKVREIVASRLEKAGRKDFLEVLGRIFENSSPEELANYSAEDIYGSSLALWKFSERRELAAAKVRIYNPRMSKHGWETSHTVLEVANDDMPFLVDSVIAFLTERGLTIHSLVHPVLGVKRNTSGERVGILGSDDDDGNKESLIQVQIDQIGDDKMLAEYEQEIAQVMKDVRVAVDDWQPILARLSEVTASLNENTPDKVKGATVEAVEFLDWLAQNHFTFLGYREYQIGGRNSAAGQVEGAALGLMRDPEYTVLRDREGNYTDWSREMDAFVKDVSPLMIIKANRRSTVHRSNHFDFIGVKKFDSKGKVVGEHVFIGHFTATAYNRSPRSIPLLRQKVERLVKRSGFSPASHDGKALTHVLETYPRDDLLQGSEKQIFRNAIGILHLSTRPRTRLFIRPDRFGRFLSCLVYVPRDRYDTELRAKIGDILADAFDGRIATWAPSFSSEVLVRVHFVVALNSEVDVGKNIADIESRIVESVRSWGDHLRDALIERKGEHEGNRLHALYHAGFGASYRDDFNAVTAIADIEKIEQACAETPLAMKFYHRLEDSDSSIRFKLFRFGRSVPLSDCLPMLENMGFRVLEEQPFSVKRGDDEIWIHDFLMKSANGARIQLSTISEKLEDTFSSLWSAKVDDDPLNRLVLVAGLDCRETALLRAYSRFLWQAKIPYSVPYMEDSLVDNPEIARSLVALFHALFDPSTNATSDIREAAAVKITNEINAALEDVASLEVDRILRRFLNAILSTLRTNYYQPDRDGQPKHHMSFKFDCEQLEDMPLPRPWREIFVFSTSVEGVHLRFGAVARGGLRWSDRKEDYRTEVLGLVKAQQVKNAVIVPVGSKGGFLPKNLPVGGTRDEFIAEGIRCYRIFLSGLLDLTDNLSGSDVIPPDAVVRRDTDDPYLVVAADKGTATFSDIANALAIDYGFWLGDAFASGGSNGYDHKGMGITAKGAWEAVKRHFRELGHDIQSQPFSVVGCGDMSGDVFGNGMLLSDQTKLIAAFDHRDIFIDPDPDTAASFAERQRLFDLPRSSWQSYNAKLISKGGGIFPRSAKSIKLTPEIQSITGLTKASVTPFELINTLLKSKVDLVWFGGIGTYIKSSEETHSDADDRANDAIRVDASELRARVVGEGANLGVTQRARIELATNGVSINNDAVDNSAGVDCSDHEVNIKIALGAVVEAGDMTEKQRNKLLAEMTDEVGDLVLKNNYNQTLAISLVESQTPALLQEHAQFMHILESEDKLNRIVEFLPADDEIAERKSKGLGMTRPEISVLVAYAKIDIFSDLVQSDIPDDPYMDRFLFEYMPGPIREKYKDVLGNHRLRREIIATIAANAMVNESGPTLYARLREETGASVGDIVKAFIIARMVFGLPEIAAEINALDNKVSASAQTEMHLALSTMISAQSLRIVQGNSSSIGEAIEIYKSGVGEIEAIAGQVITAYSKNRLISRTADLVNMGAPEALAARVASLELLGGAIDIIDVAARLGCPTAHVAANYFAAGARFGLDWLRSSARAIEVTDHWERIALSRMMSDLRAHQSSIGAAALTLSDVPAGEESIAKWIAENGELTKRIDKLIGELHAGDRLSIAKLAVASSQLTVIAN